MNVNRLDPEETDLNSLGAYLRGRRERLDPVELGFIRGRRRTPGLRREEVAQRANISPAWYSWLEQGRGGAPSAEVLARLGESLMLSEAEREHLFFLAYGRPAQVSYRAVDSITPRMQRLLDSMETTPAVIVATATYDVLAWNCAAKLLFIDFGELPLHERNILKLTFRPGSSPIQNVDRLRTARFVVSSFRADAVRLGAMHVANGIAAELCETSSEFKELWNDNEVRVDNEGTLRLYHPSLGLFQTEYSDFNVAGRPDLSMTIHHAVDPLLSERIRALVRADLAK